MENAYEDARTQFFNDILTGNAPDMFMAGDIDLKMFAQKGLIEDLAPYLESSTVIGVRSNKIKVFSLVPQSEVHTPILPSGKAAYICT